jgi:pimeloyl-[acyl-carrier protein] synthase
LIHKAFSPRIIEQMRGSVNRLANELLDAVEAQGQMDLVTDFAYPLPVQVICALLGIPATDHHLLREWTEAIARALDLHQDEERLHQAAQAATATIDYLAGLADERRRHPQSDLLSALLAVEEKGEQLTRDELFATCALLLMAGHETTANLIINGVLAMLRQRSQWELLVADPTLASTAVEEVLRYDAPVQMVMRLVQEEFSYGEFTFEVGQLVTLMCSAAGRDPQRFANPEQLDITRQNIQHFGFGSGIHYCLGAPLARMEAAIAFATLSRRFPKLALQESALVYRPNASLRALLRLPVTF